MESDSKKQHKSPWNSIDIITEIKMLEEDDDLNTNYFSEEKELIKKNIFQELKKLMRR